MSCEQTLRELAARTLDAARRRNLTIIVAESCTKLAVLLSEVPGAAEYFHGGFVTYTKANKTKSLGVPSELLEEKGAVCPEVAIAMATGALARSPANLAVAITGVAGPDPDEDGTPVGLVCIALAGADSPPRSLERRYGAVGRETVQALAMADALGELALILEQRIVSGGNDLS